MFNNLEENIMSTKADFQTFNSAKRSVSGRLKRLKSSRVHWSNQPSPIQKIGCFAEEIDSMEKTLLSMQSRLDRATIKIPD